jgi:hypothetical protein
VWGRGPLPKGGLVPSLPRAAAAADIPTSCGYYVGSGGVLDPPFEGVRPRCTLRTAMARVIFLAGLGRSGIALRLDSSERVLTTLHRHGRGV